MGNNKGAIVILGVLAVAGLFFSAYMFISYEILDLAGANGEDGTNGIDGTDGTDGTIIVALWDDLDKNTTNPTTHTLDYDYLFQFEDIEYSDSSYITLNSATSFFLTQPGLYKVSLKCVFSGIAPDQQYAIQMVISGSLIKEFFVYFSTPINFTNQWYQVDSDIYMNASGTDYYEIRAFSYTSDAFDLTASNYNQLAFEYLFT